VIRLRLLAHLPELFIRRIGGGDDAVDLGDEILLGHPFVDAPEQKPFGKADLAACRQSWEKAKSC
jgi:hypothetical protein